MSGELHSCTVVNHHLDYVDIALIGSPIETSPTELQSTQQYTIPLAENLYQEKNSPPALVGEFFCPV